MAIGNGTLLIPHQQNITMLAVRYEELSIIPKQVLKEIFTHFGISINNLNNVFQILEKDSQEGSFVSRENIQKRANTLPKSYLTEMKRLLQKHPLIQIPDFIVPNTECIS